MGTLQGGSKGEGGDLVAGKEPPPTAETWQRARQATPSHPGAGERRGFGEDDGG